MRIAPLTKRIRAAYPDSQLVLLANNRTRTVLGSLGIFDRIVSSRLYYQGHRSHLGNYLHQVRELVRLIWQLGRGYDCVITFWNGETSLHLLGFAVGTGQRIGYRSRFPRLLTSEHGWFRFDADHTRQHISLLKAAGIHDVDPEPPIMAFTAGDELAIDALLARHGVSDHAQLLLLHVGSDWACQQWAADRWAELADAVAQRYDVQILFTGVESERRYIEQIREMMRAPSLSLAGETTLGQLAALVTRAACSIAVDSILVELAQSAHRCVVVLAGPSMPEFVVPGRQLPVIINPLSPREKDEINSCRATKDRNGGCMDRTCPMAGLKAITVSDVLCHVETVAHRISLPVRPTNQTASFQPHGSSSSAQNIEKAV